VAEIVGATASNNDAIAGLRDFRQKLLHNLADTISVDQLRPLRVQSSLKTSAQESFEQPVVSRIPRLFTLRDQTSLTIHAEGDLVGQPLVPELPTQPRRHLFRNDGASASKFPIDRNDANHGHTPIRRRPPLPRRVHSS